MAPAEISADSRQSPVTFANITEYRPRRPLSIGVIAPSARGTGNGPCPVTRRLAQTCAAKPLFPADFHKMNSESATLNDLETRLLAVVRTYGEAAVALSAGVDSTLVAAAAFRALGDRAVAFTAVSPSLPRGEREAAIELARHIGIRHELVETRELDNASYAANPVNRCYFCKSTLYAALVEIAPTLGVKVLVNGANLDDTGDYRPGMQAAREFEVRSPLIEAGFHKTDVRRLAEHWGLPNWNKPAGPCLSSRIAYGVAVTPERLERIDAAERWLKQRLGLEELRVRLEEHDLARIEVPPPALLRLVTSPLRDEVLTEFRRLGFRAATIDLAGFHSGSLNALVPLVLQQQAMQQ